LCTVEEQRSYTEIELGQIAINFIFPDNGTPDVDGDTIRFSNFFSPFSLDYHVQTKTLSNRNI
jgi:hypothetical protein